MSRRDEERELIARISDRAPHSLFAENVAALGLERAVDAQILWDAYLDLVQSHGFRLASWNRYPEVKESVVAARESLAAAYEAIQQVVNDREAGR